MDLTESIVKAFVDHVFLIIGMGVILWWVAKNILPKELKLLLNNGGGDIIRKIVKDENDRQEVRQAAEFRTIIKEHEEVERIHFETAQKAEQEIREIAARNDARINLLENIVYKKKE
jgi:hypothetical protein